MPPDTGSTRIADRAESVLHDRDARELRGKCGGRCHVGGSYEHELDSRRHGLCNETVGCAARGLPRVHNHHKDRFGPLILRILSAIRASATLAPDERDLHLAEPHMVGERLTGDPAGMLEQVGVGGGKRQRDPVGELEPGVLAHRVDPVDSS